MINWLIGVAIRNRFIAVAACYGKPNTETPAVVHYAQVESNAEGQRSLNLLQALN